MSPMQQPCSVLVGLPFLLDELSYVVIALFVCGWNIFIIYIEHCLCVGYSSGLIGMVLPINGRPSKAGVCLIFDRKWFG